MHKTHYRKVALALLAVAIVALSVFGAAGSASAHANLLFTSPASNATVPAMPRVLTLVFDQAVTIDATPVTLTGPHGKVSMGAAALSHGNTSVDIRVPAGQSAGIYHVNWQVTAADGDVLDGSYPFAIGPVAETVGSTPTVGTGGAWETGILRGLLFAALALSLGELGSLWLLRRIPTPDRVRSWIPWAAIIGAAASVGLAVLLLGNGSLIESFTRPTFGALTSRPGIVALVETAGFVFAALTAKLRPSWSWLPLIAVVVAEALRAHPGIANPVFGTPLTVLHLGGAALWVGTLVYLLRTALAWRRQPASSRAAIAAYSRPAIWLFSVVAITGLASALLLLPASEILSTDYGRVLLVKVATVALAAGLAGIARRRLHRKASVQRVARPARLEAIALAGVLVLSAVLTVLPPPADPNAPLPFAPPAIGLAVPVGTLAGNVEVNAQASAGQLVVQLNAPQISNQSSGRPVDTPAALSGALAAPSGKVTQLAFRSCGAGCFFTPTIWRNGSSQLTLSPVIGGWKSVTTGLTIEWPARPAGELLGQTIAAMKAVPALTLYERVTGDSTQGVGQLSTFKMSGSGFIQRSLFASGKVPAVVRLPDVGGNQLLVISYPAEGAVDELTIAPDGRILRETLSSSNIVTHTFVYPEAEMGNK